MKYYEMKVTAVAVDPTNQAPMVILKDAEEKKVLPIWVGITEAAAILTELEEIETDRPMTHDLVKNIISSLGADLKKITVTDMRDNVYYATLSMNISSGDIMEIDCRPSDAIALAMRFCVPILVSESVILKSRVVELSADDVRAKSSEELVQILESISDEDFGKYKM